MATIKILRFNHHEVHPPLQHTPNYQHMLDNHLQIISQAKYGIQKEWEQNGSCVGFPQ